MIRGCTLQYHIPSLCACAPLVIDSFQQVGHALIVQPQPQHDFRDQVCAARGWTRMLCAHMVCIPAGCVEGGSGRGCACLCTSVGIDTIMLVWSALARTSVAGWLKMVGVRLRTYAQRVGRLGEQLFSAVCLARPCSTKTLTLQCQPLSGDLCQVVSLTQMPGCPTPYQPYPWSMDFVLCPSSLRHSGPGPALVVTRWVVVHSCHCSDTQL